MSKYISIKFAELHAVCMLILLRMRIRLYQRKFLGCLGLGCVALCSVRSDDI